MVLKPGLKPISVVIVYSLQRDRGEVSVHMGCTHTLWTSPTFKALAHYKDFHKDFSEKIFVKIVVHT